MKMRASFSIFSQELGLMSVSGLVLHIAEEKAWENAKQIGEYRADSLDSQGFIHCSQVIEVANLVYKGRKNLHY